MVWAKRILKITLAIVLLNDMSFTLTHYALIPNDYNNDAYSNKEVVELARKESMKG